MSDSYVCINCGAALTFKTEAGEAAQAACAYCGVVNQRAQAELMNQRAEERRTALAEAARRRLTLQVAGGVAAVVIAVVAIAYLRTVGVLEAAHAEAKRAHAQVVNVRERQAAVVARLADVPTSPERDAELSGAENRLRVERSNYERAAAAYDAVVTTPWAKVCARVHGLPARAPPWGGAEW